MCVGMMFDIDVSLEITTMVKREASNSLLKKTCLWQM